MVTDDTQTENRPWLTAKEVAAAQGVKVCTVYRMIDAGLLETRKRFGTGKDRPRIEISPESVDKVLASRQTAPAK